MSGFFGKSSFGGNNKQRKYFKLKDGEQVYRILPAMGELKETRQWSIFHSVHYGYKSTDGKQKPFLSCEVKNRNNGMVDVADAAKDRLTSLKEKLEEAKKTGNKAIVDKLDPLVGAIGMYNLDNNHYMNVVDAQGNIGVLKIRHKAKLALEAEIKKLDAETPSIDPLNPETGRFFVFTRTGTGRDTTFSVRVLKEKLTVQGVGVVERDVVHVLDEDIEKRCGKVNADGTFTYNEAAQLKKIFKSLTAEEVRQVVDGSDLTTGVSPALDKFFGKGQSVVADDSAAETAETEAQAPTVHTSVLGGSTNVAAAVVAATQAAATVTPAVSKPATVTSITPKTAITPKTTAALVTEMSDADFLAALESGSL